MHGVWFRKCLRLRDNAALTKACGESDSVVPFFILDPHFDRSRIGVNRFQFLLESLRDLDEQLRVVGSRLLVLQGDPVDVLQSCFLGRGPVSLTALYWEKDSEPYARERDARVFALAKDLGVRAEMFPGHTLLDLDAVVARPGFKPPISMAGIHAFVGSINIEQPKPCPRLPPCTIDGHEVPRIGDLYEEVPTSVGFPGGEREALRRIAATCSDVDYVCSFEKPKTASTGRKGRPWEPSTTGLSPYLKFGCLSVRTAWHAFEACCKDRAHTRPPQSLLGQLLFREMFYVLSVAVPNFDSNEGNQMCKVLPWSRDEHLIALWSQGRTGYPFIDASMRQLKQTGFMHHLGRHAVACFLTRGDLWQVWTAGRDVFDRYLLDADWAINNGNWLWLAGVAPFSAPFHRIYDPSPGPKSSLNADQAGDFVRHFVPELRRMPSQYICKPWLAPLAVQQRAGCIVGEHYPSRVVVHEDARRANLAKFDALHTTGLPEKFGGFHRDSGTMESLPLCPPDSRWARRDSSATGKDKAQGKGKRCATLDTDRRQRRWTRGKDKTMTLDVAVTVSP